LNKHYTASAAAAAAAAAAQNHTKKSGEKRTEKGQGRARGERMPSSKGKPTDPELREEVKDEVKAEEKGERSNLVSSEQNFASCLWRACLLRHSDSFLRSLL
jgi:hypothetical protein